MSERKAKDTIALETTVEFKSRKSEKDHKSIDDNINKKNVEKV